MRFKICNSYGCRHELLTVREVKNRICEPHRRLLENDAIFAGVCWNCGTITIVESRQWDNKKEEYYIRDKYIFSKGCRCCTENEEDNINWMTIPGERKERIISDVAIAAITHQNNRLIVDYQPNITGS